MSSLTVIFLFLAIFFLQLSRSTAGGARSAREAALARLGASSGMEYAAARLSASCWPFDSTDAAGRGDDWTERQGAGVSGQGSDNPSYSHGEGWDDSATADGVYAGADPKGPDRDGDGRFSAWSGRLRGGGGPFGVPFSLRIESADGKIPLNAGLCWEPDGLDSDVDGQVDELDELDADGTSGWDWQQVSLHKGLIHLLNNLGVSVLPAGHPRRWEVPCGDPGLGDRIFVSWVGYDLIANRPARGYRGWSEVERILLSLGFGYTPAQVAALRPYVSLGPYEETPYFTRESGRYAPVCLWTAPPLVFDAAWRYLAARTITSRLPGDPAGWTTLCSRTGSGAIPYSAMALVLFPDESAALAAHAHAWRRGGGRGWRDLYRSLLDSARDDAAPLFARDYADFPSSCPVNRRVWCQAKADLAFQSVAIDPYLCGGKVVSAAASQPSDPLAAWASWGIDRDGIPANGVTAWAPVGFKTIGRVGHPYEYNPASPTSFVMGWAGTTGPYIPYQYVAGQSPAPTVPWGFTLSPPVRFEVESAGACGRAQAKAEGQLRVAETLEFSSQEQLENWELGRAYARRGIAVDDASVGPAARHEYRTDIGAEVPPAEAARLYPKVATLPDRSRWTVTTRAAKPVAYSQRFGAVALAPREAGQQSAKLYWPLSEDFDGVVKPSPYSNQPYCDPDPPLFFPPYPLYPPSYPSRTEHWSLPATGLAGLGPRPPGMMRGWPNGPYPLTVQPTWNWNAAEEEAATPFQLNNPPPTGLVSPPNASSGWTYIECPGFFEQDSGADAITHCLRQASIEAWMGPSSLWVVASIGGAGAGPASWTTLKSKQYVKLSTYRAVAGGLAGTVYELGIDWGAYGLLPPPGNRVQGGRRFFVRDGAAGGRTTWAHHAVLSIWRNWNRDLTTGAYTDLWTEMALYVDGEAVCDAIADVTGIALGAFTWGPWGAGGAMAHTVDGAMARVDNTGVGMNEYEHLYARGVDEIRLYGGEDRLDQGEARDRYLLGRHAPRGTYTSPRYVLDEDARLSAAEWTGMFPQGIPETSVQVYLVGYDGSGATIVNGEPLGPSGMPKDLSFLPPVRSFRYRVSFNCTGLGGVLNDTPVFESVWLSFRRRGRAPAWHGWSAR